MTLFNLKPEPPCFSECPDRTPWGQADHKKLLADGIWEVSTPSHGGIKLSPARNRLMPKYMRSAGGWYEEDCEWAKVALVFPDAFAGHAAQAHKTGADWFPDEYQTFTGNKLTLEGSYVLRQRAHKEASRDKFVAQSAFGSWAKFVPDGKVGVAARRERDGVEAWFLVPADRYNTRDGMLGYVIQDDDEPIAKPSSSEIY